MTGIRRAHPWKPRPRSAGAASPPRAPRNGADEATGLTGPQPVFREWDTVPGFEFGARGSPGSPPTHAAPGSPPTHAAPGSPRTHAAPGSPRTHASRGASGRAIPGHVPPGARAEWAGLLRSLQPAPPRHRRLTAFRAGLRFRGPGRSLIVPMMAMVVLGVAAVVLMGANRSHPGPPPAPASLGLPPATLAGGIFTAAGRSPGEPQMVDVDTVAAGADAPGMLVAAGRANGHPAAWVSADGGRTWTPGAGQDPAVLARPGAQQLTSVADGPDGWLAVGGPAAPATASAHPVVLTSADGRTWTAADRQAAFSLPGLVTEQAAAGPSTAAGTAAPSYVVVGYQLTAGHSVAAAWWSAGLAGWHRAAERKSTGTTTAGTQMHAVTAAAGGFVAAGSAGDQPAAWTSADGGRTWTQRTVPPPAGATRAALTAVAASARTVVAMGTATTANGHTRPFAVTSRDAGATWTPAPVPVPEAAGDATITALTAERTGFFAAGTVSPARDTQHVVVWTSAHGSAWTTAATSGPALAGPGRQAITGLTASGVTLTGVGFTVPPGGNQQPVFWQLPAR